MFYFFLNEQDQIILYIKIMIRKTLEVINIFMQFFLNDQGIVFINYHQSQQKQGNPCLVKTSTCSVQISSFIPVAIQAFNPSEKLRISRHVGQICDHAYIVIKSQRIKLATKPMLVIMRICYYLPFLKLHDQDTFRIKEVKTLITWKKI